MTTLPPANGLLSPAKDQERQLQTPISLST
jgi:hypothetical protein